MFVQAEEFRNDGSLQDTEICNGVIEPGVRKIVIYGVKAFGRHSLDPSIPTLKAASKDHGKVSRYRRSIQLLDLFGLVLQIAVHDDNPITGGMGKPCRDGIMLAKIPGETDRLAAGIGCGNLAYRIPRAIRAGILHKDNFKVCGDGLDCCHKPPAELFDAWLSHIDGRDNGYERRRLTHDAIIGQNGMKIKRILLY